MISIIIPNYNGEKYLSDCIGALYNQDYLDYEVILVDNASSDNSLILVKNQFPGIILVENPVNRGFAGGCNDGARKARGDYLLFINTDTIAPLGFLSTLFRATITTPDYAMFATKMIYPDGRINSAGICISLSGAAWDRGMGEYDRGQYDKREEVLGPCGGAAMYRTKEFTSVGGFDEDFFLYMEDVDLAFRIRLGGGRCLYIPGAVIVHYHGGTAGVETDIAIYYGNRNIIWYPVKDFPLMLLIFSIPWILGRTIGVIGYYALKGRGRIAMKAKWDGIKGIPHMVQKRRLIPVDSTYHDITQFLFSFAFHAE
jgi:GT2 family glycosyltransferase